RQEAFEQLGLPGRRLDVATRLEREVGLESPIDAVVQGALRDHALLNARDIGGGDMDERGSRPTGEHATVEVHRAEQVRLETFVDRWIERDGRRGEDGDVAAARKIRLPSR